MSTFAAQAQEFPAFFAGQAVAANPGMNIGLLDPVADGLPRETEFISKIVESSAGAAKPTTFSQKSGG
jgi:hypothetical protein